LDLPPGLLSDARIALTKGAPMLASILTATAISLAALTGPAYAQAADIAHATLGETSPTVDISTAEMQQALNDGLTIVIDARTVAEFDAGHIPGARLVKRTASSRVDAISKMTNGDKAAKLVLYCNGPHCKASRSLAAELVKGGYTNVTRYQLGLPVWRALGGPVAVEQGGIARIFKADQTAVFIDTRPAADFAKGTLGNARNIRVEELASARLPDDDFNRRIILFGSDAREARKAADIMGKRSWHNVSYYPGTFESLRQALTGH
jgi:rhodanese-related sulfurtransferase